MDADPDLEWHVAEAATAGPLDHAGLRELAGELLAERLDHERPLWRIDVAPLDDGGTALIGRVHHAMADGVTAIRLVGELLWDPAAKRRRPSGEAAASGSRQGRRGAAAPEREPRLRSEDRRVPCAASCARARTPSSTATSAPTARSPGGPSLWRA